MNFYSGTSNSETVSKISIDKGRTFEVYFKLNKTEKCLKFAVQSKAAESAIRNTERVYKTYFLVEKAVNISQFRDKTSEKIIYYELGKNFDYRWNRRRELLICSIRDDPIKKFNRSSYRIRFTTYINRAYNFKITVHSNHKITFIRRDSAKQGN